VDFFGAQDQARRHTWRLAALFGAAVLSLVLLTNLLVAVVYAWSLGYGDPLDPLTSTRVLPARYWFWISFAVVGAVGLACLQKYLELRGGGRAIAEALGGRLVQQNTADQDERRLLNVVEEMAIAAGLPVPPVYVIPEPSINAFAAGLGFSDAVIGVNQGTLEHLNRDELQGVIAHEFSHLLNGDSRLNLRLLALLHGILFIGMVGMGLLRGVGAATSRRRSRGGASAGAPLLFLGVGLAVIGYAGTVFGRLIKAAVSRQREYLADAAAVQFTRNPLGIANALKKIGGLAAGSQMRSAAAEEASHIFFGPVRTAWFGGLTATHPPLERRIRVLDSHWDGRFPAVLPASALTATQPPRSGVTPGFADAPGDTRSPAGSPAAAATQPKGSVTAAETVSAAVGRVDDAALAQAIQLLNGFPPALHEAAHDPWAARALLFALVLAEDRRVAATQIGQVEQLGEAGLARETARLAALAPPLDPAQRLALVELTIPALKEMSEPQYRRFSATLITLIKADQRIDLFEWVLHRILIRDLRSHFEPGAASPARSRQLDQCGPAIAVLLSALAREQAADAAAASVEAAFARGLLTIGLEASFDAAADPDFQRLNHAVRELQGLPPLQKPRLIKACAATVLADHQVSPRQGALLQGIAAALDCPLPPSIYSA